jgi:hypothetical protein
MHLDYEKFRHYLADHNMSHEEENEVMENVWSWMSEAAAKAWGMHPLQHVKQEKAYCDLQASNKVIDSKVYENNPTIN